MNVRLIAITKPTFTDENNFQLSSEDLISYCARVSNPSNQENFNTSDKLLKYCADHRHWSVFEMANAILEIETTRDIARQILRHRSFSFQEFSQRYADPSQLGFEIREVRMQDHKNRQNSIELDDFDATNEFKSDINTTWKRIQQEIIDLVSLRYEWAIKSGIAKEQARSILPEGLTKSRMYMSGSIRSWIHYIQTRNGLDTQKEHRIIAEEAKRILSEHFKFMEKL